MQGNNPEDFDFNFRVFTHDKALLITPELSSKNQACEPLAYLSYRSQ
jgi:hypothetical protein